MKIEMYPHYLFDHWKNRTGKINLKAPRLGNTKKVSWNKGILLLVAVENRKVSIELSANYGLTKTIFAPKLWKTIKLLISKRGIMRQEPPIAQSNF